MGGCRRGVLMDVQHTEFCRLVACLGQLSQAEDFVQMIFSEDEGLGCSLLIALASCFQLEMYAVAFL